MHSRRNNIGGSVFASHNHLPGEIPKPVTNLEDDKHHFVNDESGEGQTPRGGLLGRPRSAGIAANKTPELPLNRDVEADSFDKNQM